MAQRLSETYRGFHVVIEVVADDASNARLHRTITRQLGERLIAVQEHSETRTLAAPISSSALADALRDAREAVNTLLGGWHPAYTQEQSASQGSSRG
jgi:hypothetical protein